MSMPSPAADLHIVSVDYACTFAQLPPGGGPVAFSCPDPVHFTFTFETGVQPLPGDVFQYSWDYSWFNQPQVELAIGSALDQICASIAALLTLSITVVNASVTVRRVWTIAPNVQGPGVGTGRIATIDVMPYPHVVLSADSAAVADAGEATSVVNGASG